MSNSDLKVAARGDRELVISRTFDAPAELVFDAYTKPELLRQWLLGADGWTMTVCDVDLRVGGKYRYVWHKEKTGEDMAMGGDYQEISEPEKLVATEQFDQEWYPGGALSTITFTETDGRTFLENVMRYDTHEAREAVLASPMEEGLAPGYDRLNNLVTAMSTSAAGGE
jgi:uncharacterized protein YndB with AHSA1/START domain